MKGERAVLILCALSEEQLHNNSSRAEQLIDRMAHGDMAAMGELYELLKTDVFAYALSRAASRADAEDVMQDTFVQVWRAAAQYKPQGKPLAWIFTIEINLIRRQFKRQEKLLSLDETIEAPSSGSSFSEEVINNEFLRHLMQRLNDDEREIITLHVVSGLKHREIAQLLQKPLSTVLSKYNRALKKLQASVGKEDT